MRDFLRPSLVAATLLSSGALAWQLSVSSRLERENAVLRNEVAALSSQLGSLRGTSGRVPAAVEATKSSAGTAGAALRPGEATKGGQVLARGADQERSAGDSRIQAHAEQPRAGEHRQLEEAMTATPEQAVTTLDPDRLKAVDTRIAGTDIKRLYSILADMKIPEKTPYETAVEHARRAADFVKSKKIDGHASDSPLAFEPALQYKNGMISYVAERKAFKITLGGSKDMVVEGAYGRDFVGQNAFGVTATVRTRQVDTWTLVFVGRIPYHHSNPPHLMDYYTRYDDIYVKMSPDLAQEIGPTLRVLLIGRLAFPFLDRDSSFERATLRRSEETSYSTKSVCIRLERVILFNGRSGEVIRSVKPTMTRL